MNNFYKILMLLSLITGSFGFAQTGVTVTYYTGTTQGFNVAATGKLYFASDNLYIKVDGVTTPTTIPVNIIRKITFASALATTSFGENPNHLVLYPNPSSEVIKISSDVLEELKVNIYSLSGRLVHQGNYAVNQDITISDLASGLYLVQVNGVTIKFSKR